MFCRAEASSHVGLVYLSHLTRYFFLSPLWCHTILFFRISFTLYLFFLLTMCDSNYRSIIHWERRGSSAADHSMTEWNTLCIPDGVFNWNAWELIFLIMVYLAFLTSNFLHSRSVWTFFRFSQILSFFLKLYNCCCFWFAVSFCACWVTVMVIWAHFIAFFIFCMIWSAFWTELFPDCTRLNFSNNCRDFMWYSCDRKKRLTPVDTESWLFMTSSAIESKLTQLLWL